MLILEDTSGPHRDGSQITLEDRGDGERREGGREGGEGEGGEEGGREGGREVEGGEEGGR